MSCTKDLKVGTTMMGQAAQASTAQSVKLTRSGTELACGATIKCSDVLKAKFSGASPVKWMLEVAGGAFGGTSRCTATRVDNTNDAVVTVPATAGTLKVRAGWASGYGQVSISDDCTYTIEAGTGCSSAPAAPAPAPDGHSHDDGHDHDHDHSSGAPRRSTPGAAPMAFGSLLALACALATARAGL